ncbi:hypothetical protein SAMN05216466_1383 [Paraburkholderia phenazinium]|uniref:Uncharacterized protein n=1 Tax=Paraburkholderia phenazinium TaxID=60549 RepID=A0A1G8NY27_9BURK|nr:hypothetical protein SAMN05216466_1383 [Paraburkholderia phenazinium]
MFATRWLYLVEPLLRDVFQVQPGDLLASEPFHRARRLAQPQIAAVAEERRDETLARIVDLRVKPG